jgi:hypothetical protein
MPPDNRLEATSSFLITKQMHLMQVSVYGINRSLNYLQLKAANFYSKQYGCLYPPEQNIACSIRVSPYPKTHHPILARVPGHNLSRDPRARLFSTFLRTHTTPAYSLTKSPGEDGNRLSSLLSSALVDSQKNSPARFLQRVTLR